MAPSSLDKLRRRAQDAAKQEAAAAQRRPDDARAQAFGAAAASPPARWRYRRAPDSPFQSDLFAWLAVLAMVVVGVFVVQSTGDAFALPLAVYGWAIAGLGAAALLVWLEGASWRLRMPFVVDGDRVIEGYDAAMGGSGAYDYDPWIEVRVELVLSDGGTHEAVGHALALLALHNDQTNWRIEGNVATGRVNLSFYTDRRWRSWLLGEMKLVHAVAPIRVVRMTAAYTGTGVRTQRAGLD